MLLTNQLSRSACHLIGRYAKRMLIENNIEDGIDFFHMDALSSAVAMKVNCDLQLTLMASSLYRLLAVRIGNGYETSKSRQLFLDFINASADITITEEAVVVKFQKRKPAQSLAGRRRVRQDEDRGPVVRRQAIEVRLWLASCMHLRGAWCKVEN